MAGPIPTAIGHCSQLKELKVSGNFLTGVWHFVIVLFDGKRVYQLTKMHW